MLHVVHRAHVKVSAPIISRAEKSMPCSSFCSQDGCCTSNIISSGVSCSTSDEAPCVMDAMIEQS